MRFLPKYITDQVAHYREELKRREKGRKFYNWQRLIFDRDWDELRPYEQTMWIANAHNRNHPDSYAFEKYLEIAA